MLKVASTLALLCSSLSSAEFLAPTPNPTDIRVIPVGRTPESETVKTTLMFPEKSEIKQESPVRMQIRLEGYPLGVDSDFPRVKEIYNDPKGQSLHIVIDEHPYIPINYAVVDSYDDSEEYFDIIVEFKIPFKLEPGIHTARVFPVRSFNESLKGDGCYAADIFYYRSKTPSSAIDLNKPYLTYNEPDGEYDYSPTIPILLDYYLSNCRLSRDGYKVRLTIDENIQRVLTQWTPCYIYGLNKGMHTVRLELLDEQNNLVAGPYSDVQHSFAVK